jgi:hypothetical protein
MSRFALRLRTLNAAALGHESAVRQETDRSADLRSLSQRLDPVFTVCHGSLWSGHDPIVARSFPEFSESVHNVHNVLPSGKILALCLGCHTTSIEALQKLDIRPAIENCENVRKSCTNSQRERGIAVSQVGIEHVGEPEGRSHLPVRITWRHQIERSEIW